MKDDPSGVVVKNETISDKAAHGALAGAAAALVTFPFESAKKKFQSGQPIIWSLREFYRGCSAFVVSLTPTGAIQVASNILIKQKLGEGRNAEITSGVAAGGLGAVASTAVENVILRQQLQNTGPKQAINSLFAEGALRIWRGLALISGREAIFGFSYMWGSKEASKHAKENYGEQFALPAKIGVGIAGALISHPLDTTATVRQKHASYLSTKDAAKQIMTESGLKGFYKGAVPRCLLFTGAMLTSEKVLSVFDSDVNETEKPKLSK
jgi:hypothetical protein